MFEEFNIPKHRHDGIDSLVIFQPDRNLNIKRVQAGITANVGSTQATGEKIYKDIAEISTCVNAGDSLTLPPASAGLQILIMNHGANSADIFPAIGDKIDEGAANAAKALAADASLLCTTYDSENWECLVQAR